MKTLYTILGIGPGVDADDLEQAYLRRKVGYPQAKLDSDDNARIQWQGIEQAYKTLANPDSRAMYDRRLKSAGVKTVTVAPAYDDDRPGWLSSRNVLIIGAIVLVVSGMWYYHAQTKAKMAKQLIEQALKIAEEEKKQQAELQAAEEVRRQARFQNQQQRDQQSQDRAFQREAQQSVREAQDQSRQADYAAQSAARQAEHQQQQRERTEQAEKRQVQQDAERRLANEKQQLRNTCMQRYGRPDC